MESLENERKEDRASFEEEKRVIESNWQKTLNDQVEKLMKTQELTVTKLSQKIESLEKERKEDRASFEEEKRVIESNWQKTLNDQVEKLMKTQELAVTKLSQKIKELENERQKDRTSFEEQKREIESKWKKIAYDQVQMLKTQGNELGTITLIIQYHDSGPMEQSCLNVNQHMQLEELKGKLCAKFRIHQSLIHITHGGQDLSRGGREDLKTAGLENLSVLDVSKKP